MQQVTAAMRSDRQLPGRPGPPDPPPVLSADAQQQEGEAQTKQREAEERKQERGKRWRVKQVGGKGVGRKHDNTHLPRTQIIIQQLSEKETPETERTIKVK